MDTDRLHVFKLRGRDNYREWKFVIDLLIQQEIANYKSSSKKNHDYELDLKIRPYIATHVEENILVNIAACTTYRSMLTKLEELYGLRQDDIDAYHAEFHGFKLDKTRSLQENLCVLENIRSKIRTLGEDVSDSAFKTKIFSILPPHFSGFIAACNLNSSLHLTQIITALISEDIRYRRTPQNSSAQPSSTVCFYCHKVGHLAKNCRLKPSSPTNTSVVAKSVEKKPSKDSSNAQKTSSSTTLSDNCYYCKEPGHRIKTCTKLKAKNNAVCATCNQKGHYTKNCSSSSSESFTACINFASLSAVPVPSKQISRKSWVLDCACTSHIVNDPSFFANITPIEADILVGDSSNVNVKYKGTVYAESNSAKLQFNDVLLNEQSPANLISVIKLLKNGWIVSEFVTNRIVLTKNSVRIIGTLDGHNLYSVPVHVIVDQNSSANSSINSFVSSSVSSPVNPSISSSVNSSVSSFVNSSSALLTLSQWHRNFAHQNLRYTRDVLVEKNIPFRDDKPEKCNACLKGKATRLPFSRNPDIAAEVGDLIHVDLLFSPVRSLANSKYALVFKDDKSKFRSVYFLATKQNTVSLFQDYINLIRTQTGHTVKKIRSDNGTEAINSEINRLCSDNGIIHELSCPFTPEQNGRIEREMRTLSEAVTTILLEANLGKFLWAEAMNYVVFTLNRVSKSSVAGKTPFEVFFGNSNFDFTFLRPFGTKVVAQIPSENRKKFDPKGYDGIFVGYPPNTKGYRIYVPSLKIIRVTRNVTFVETPPSIISSQPSQDFVPDQPAADSSTEIIEIEYDYDWDSDSDNNPSQATSESVALFAPAVPKKFDDLRKLNDDNREFWMSAVEKELTAMQRHNVWTVVPFDNQKVIDTRWVFRLKDTTSGPIPRARLVARGFLSNDFDNTYAPVASIISVRTILAVAVQFSLKLTHIDVETAFLNGSLAEDIFLRPPKGVDVPDGHVLKLNKALYGLRQAPKSWYDKIDSVLVGDGFVRSQFEHCLYVQNSRVFVLIYVDDLLIATSNHHEFRSVVNLLRRNFTIKVSVNLDKFIGLSIRQEHDKLLLNQTEFVDEAARKFRVEDCKPVTTPMDVKLDLSRPNSSSKSSVKQFQKLLGTLRYINERSRPDISFAVAKLSRFANVATDELYRYLVRILKYLVTTKDRCLVYEPNSSASPLDAYSDASWASEIDRKSTSGYFIRVFGSVVHYKSKKQSLVALSTAEAEFVALSECCRSLIWIKGILANLQINVPTPTVYEDNQSAIKIAENRTNYNRTKHLDIKYHFIKDLVDKHLVKIQYVESANQAADGLTKALPPPQFHRFITSMNLK